MHEIDLCIIVLICERSETLKLRDSFIDYWSGGIIVINRSWMIMISFLCACQLTTMLNHIYFLLCFLTFLTKCFNFLFYVICFNYRCKDLRTSFNYEGSLMLSSSLNWCPIHLHNLWCLPYLRLNKS